MGIAIEQDFHDFEEICTSCFIERQFDSSLPDCPSVTCTDQNAQTTAFDFLEANCQNDCSSNSCRDNYRIIRAYHDTCDEILIIEEIEREIHEFEEVCEDQECNT